MKKMLRVFVYGTLKKGLSNHIRHCSGVSRIEPAYLYGKLFSLTPHIPVLLVPESNILATGSKDTAADLALQDRCGGPSHRAPRPRDPWRRVNGELHSFSDPETRLPRLDDLEEFRPGEDSTYLRVLVNVTLADAATTTAWTYIAGFDTSALETYPGETWLPEEGNEDDWEMNRRFLAPADSKN